MDYPEMLDEVRDWLKNYCDHEDPARGIKVICRYCGAEMRECDDEHNPKNGRNFPGFGCWYFCPECGSESPFAATRKDAHEIAVSGFLKREDKSPC